MKSTAVASVTPALRYWMKPNSGIATISLSNHTTLNALSFRTLSKLYQQIQKCYQDPLVKVVVLQSDVQGIFSSGHDLKEFHDIQQQQSEGGDDVIIKEKFHRVFRVCSEMVQSISSGPKPIIAKIDGIATAAGCQLVASCDLAYASSKSKFGIPGVNIGLFPFTPGIAVAKTCKQKHVMELLLTGELISAKEAERIGLINSVVEGNSDDLDQHVEHIATIIASKSQQAIQYGKPLFAKQMEFSSLKEAYDVSSQGMVDGLMRDECKEGIDAFLSKRKPQWPDTTTSSNSKL